MAVAGYFSSRFFTFFFVCYRYWLRENTESWEDDHLKQRENVTTAGDGWAVMDGLVEPFCRPLADRVHFQRQQPQQPVEWARKPLGGSWYGDPQFSQMCQSARAASELVTFSLPGFGGALVDGILPDSSFAHHGLLGVG